MMQLKPASGPLTRPSTASTGRRPAGSSGWRSFEDFKQRIVDRSKTRVLALLNIVGAGMRGDKFEQNLGDMDAKPTAEMALRYKGVVVGIKTAHYAGPEWTPVTPGNPLAWCYRASSRSQ